MAKEKNIAKDYVPKKVDLGDGFVVEMRLRVVGLQYLEDVYDKSIAEIDFGSGRVKELVNLFTALALSSYPDMPVDEIKKRIGQLDMEQMDKIFAEAPDVFGVRVKNLKRPSPKKVTGNLVES
jgi:hypothetical protein